MRASRRAVKRQPEAKLWISRHKLRKTELSFAPHLVDNRANNLGNFSCQQCQPRQVWLTVSTHGRKCIRRSISRVLFPHKVREATIPLGQHLRAVSRDRPGRPAQKRACRLEACRRPYLVLLPVGFAKPPPLPATRCALTAPFHLDPQAPCGTQAGRPISVALSLESPPPGVTRHRASVEPGLSSPTPLLAAARPPDRLMRPWDVS